ncbi:Pyroglutamylated RFamide peptide receptor [Holothuria leucospilota]|uniref:Pyroglutamylated RFamide peptide receptor n=1 Tax=Holothuria leucospilota TaxID=206669 RepID=A0A9Q0YP86_HOLLE|nr:Pyroglutamylated RFamide peptide receptor [Holothuria leucospilota]
MVISTVVDERWFTICCSFIACFAISGNILVIVVHQTSRSLRSVTSIFIKGLAATDMLAGIAIVPGMIPITITDNFWGEFYCKVIGSYYILWTSAKASILILVFATTERYFAIVHPVHHKRYFTNLAAKILLVLAWVIAVLMNLFSLIILHADGDSCIVRWDGNKHVRNLIGVMVFVLSFFLPLTLMFLAYTKMFVSLRDREKRLNRMDGTRSNKSRSRIISHRIKKNIISMLFIVVCTFTICWAPDQICYLLMNLEVKSFDYEYSVVYPYFVLLAMANSCLNPIIYSFKSKPFKDALRKMLGRKNRVQDNGGSLNSIAQNCSATGLGTSPPVGNTNAKTTDSSETVSPAL